MPTDTEQEQQPNPDAAVTIEPAADAAAADPDQLPPLIMGEPFAYSGVSGTNNPQLLPEDDKVGVPGCNASLLCSCGQPFLVDLLTDKPASICPHCNAAYTHVLVVAGLDDANVWGETNIEVLRANGIVEPDADDDDDDQGDADNPAEPSALVDEHGRPLS